MGSFQHLFCIGTLFAAFLSTAAAAPVPPSSSVSLIEPALVSDINRQGAGSSIGGLTDFQGSLYFLRSNSDVELWRSDGTAAGTTLVHTVVAGSSSTRHALRLFRVGEYLLILVEDYRLGGGIWTSDGTAAGTTLLLPLQSSKNSYRTLAVGSELFFFANYAVPSGYELWRSDGTLAGTGLLKDINPGDGSSFPQVPAMLGERLYFTADDGSGTQLWRSDGSTDTTVRVDADAPGTLPENMYGLYAVGSQVYIAAGIYETTPLQIWRTAGSAATSVQVQTLDSRWRVTEGTAFGDAFAFVVDRACAQYPCPGEQQLWLNTGSVGAERMLAELAVVRNLKALDSQLFFFGNNAVNGGELWVSDGSAAGTHQVSDLSPGSDGFGWSAPTNLTEFAGLLYFAARTYMPERALWEAGLWRSDGSTAGTQLVYAYTSPIDTEMPHSLIVFDEMLFFMAWEWASGFELWRSDGSTAGTIPVRDLTPATLSANPRSLTQLNNLVIFTADDAVHGEEIWRSDGTDAGTYLLADLTPGPASSYIWQLVSFGGYVFFVPYDGPQSRTLWRTDGTPQGTLRILSPDLHVVERSLAVSGGKLFFSGNLGDGYELWASDGSPAGTYRVRDIAPGWSGSNPQYLTAVNGEVFFLIGTDDAQLWKSDGSAAGTVQVSAKPIDELKFTLYGTAVVGSTLFFVNDDDESGTSLWKSDGTAAGTGKVSDLGLGTTYVGINQLTVLNDIVYFIESSGCDLWRSDGTESGTWPVKDFTLQSNAPYTGMSCTARLETNGERLFLAASVAEANSELWVSDGTTDGTTLLKEIRPGLLGSYPRAMQSIYGTLLFAADDGVSGMMLWRSDGSAEGTWPVGPLGSGTAGSPPYEFMAVDRTMFLSASDSTHGCELHRINLTDLGIELQSLYLPIVGRH